ncbi:hypothetical protein JCM16303_001166 [Sporobolomyces ruberrimus]
MSLHSKADPPSPTASVTSFESCVTLNAIAGLDPPRSSSEESDEREIIESRSPSICSKKTTGSNKKEEEETHEGIEPRVDRTDDAEPSQQPSPSSDSDPQSLPSSHRSSHHSSSIHARDSVDTNPTPLEQNSPSKSDAPLRDAAASISGRSSAVSGQVEEERRSPSRRSHASSIRSDRKESSSHPTDSTEQTCRDEEADAISLKSVLEPDNASIALPTVSQNYPPRQTSSDLIDPPDGGIRAWLNVTGGFLVLFASFGYTNSWGVYQAYYSQTVYREYSNSAISWIGSVQLCLFFLLALVAGPLFDKGKFRYLLAAGSAIQIASIFLITECKEFWQTMVVQGLMSGIGIGLVFLPALSVQSHWFLRKRAFAIGIVTCGSSIGGIAFPIMLNKLFVNREVGFVDGVRASGYVVAACLLIANLVMSPHPARLIAHKPPLPPLRKIMTPIFACMTGGAFLLNWGLWMPLFYLQVFAQSKGVSSDLSFYTLAIYNAGSVFGRTIPNIAADHLGPQNIQSFCCVSAGIALYCMYVCESAAGIVTFAAIYGFLSGGFISLVSPSLISISDDISEIGLRQGVAFLIVAGGAVGGNPVCGKLLEEGPRTDPFLAPIMFAGSMALLGGIVTTLARFMRAKEKGTWRV